MALLHVNFYSRTLERETQMDVILPEAAKKLIGMEGVATRQCKTLYLLHGMSDDQTIWQRRTSIERYAAAYGLAVVMPTTDLGWYTDMYRGDKYFAFITRELPAVCRDLFPMMSPRREDTYVAGLSMGGYGALKCALRARAMCSAAGLRCQARQISASCPPVDIGRTCLARGSRFPVRSTICSPRRKRCRPRTARRCTCGAARRIPCCRATTRCAIICWRWATILPMLKARAITPGNGGICTFRMCCAGCFPKRR